MSAEGHIDTGVDAQTVHLVFPRLPPAHDGIGDYTARLAEALAVHCRVFILTAEADALSIPSVSIHRAFSLDRPGDVRALLAQVVAAPPDWLLIQYNPFSYGRRGWNPHLPSLAHTLKQRCPRMGLAVMVHEVAPPLLNWKLALMSTWQLAHLWRLGRAADVLFVATEPWVGSFRRWFPSTPVHHLPVGANVPFRPVAKGAARQTLGLVPDRCVAGVFGTAHPTRLLGHVRAAADALHAVHPDACVLYVGPDGQSVRQALGNTLLLDAGRVPAEEVGVCLSAMDVCLAPFRRGVSTRRGSFMAALQQGLPTLSTVGPQTGSTLRRSDGTAFVLTPHDDPSAFARAAVALFEEAPRRAAMSCAAQDLYRSTFDWSVLASRLFSTLRAARDLPGGRRRSSSA